MLTRSPPLPRRQKPSMSRRWQSCIATPHATWKTWNRPSRPARLLSASGFSSSRICCSPYTSTSTSPAVRGMACVGVGIWGTAGSLPLPWALAGLKEI